jgi:hypothetical protein
MLLDSRKEYNLQASGTHLYGVVKAHGLYCESCWDEQIQCTSAAILGCKHMYVYACSGITMKCKGPESQFNATPRRAGHQMALHVHGPPSTLNMSTQQATAIALSSSCTRLSASPAAIIGGTTAAPPADVTDPPRSDTPPTDACRICSTWTPVCSSTAEGCGLMLRPAPAAPSAVPGATSDPESGRVVEALAVARREGGRRS